uniref:CUB domain-containing protein n=1 Tax=Caenorhabditis japonica TaxID=281687 RepID=A0A8R1I5P5_CAEJA
MAGGYESAGNVMNVVFKTNYAVTDKGWLATWKAKKNMPVISQSGSNGTMVSPNYPSEYDSYDEQVYQISVALGMQVNMTIDDFTTEVDADYLNIYNSTLQSNSTLVATYVFFILYILSVRQNGQTRSAELNAMRFSFWFPNYFISRINST